MKINRKFTKAGVDVFSTTEWEKRTSKISHTDGSVVFEMKDAEIPADWSQLATDIVVSKYFRKAGIPQVDANGAAVLDEEGKPKTGPEKSVKQVVHRLAGCWTKWGKDYGYFNSDEDAQAFYDELAFMLIHQIAAPNSPQWFNTGLHYAYGLTGPSQGHWHVNPASGQLEQTKDAYTNPQPHACQPYDAPVSTPTGSYQIGQIVEKKLIGLTVYDGKKGADSQTEVIAVLANGEKRVYRITLSDGSFVEATADHLIYIGRSGKQAWAPVERLKPGDSVVKRNEIDAVEVALSRPTEHGIERRMHRTDIQPYGALSEIAITSIDDIGIHPVFDIQTKSGQYLSNDIVVHNCFIQGVQDDLVNEGGIMDLWTREARLFKYGSGTGTNFSQVRGENENLSGGGKSSGLMSFLKIGDRAAGAIKSGGTTRRAAKMVCLELDHPDIEEFINWKVREEIKVACLVEGIKHLPKEQQELAKKMKLKLDYDFNGEAYATVSGQNSNNSVRVSNKFLKAVEENGEWQTIKRTNGKVHKTLKARDLWEQIGYAAWRCADPGVQYDDTINEWHTCPQSGRINASNPCSEYMFLDNTACNLASVNLMKLFNNKTREFDIEGFKHACRLWTVVLEISVLMASYPSREIARLSYEYRTLGLGYANIGTMLMVSGIAYDSDVGRAVCGAVSAVMTGESYATSAEMAKEHGPFPGYRKNRNDMLRVMRNHRAAAYNNEGDYEGLTVKPVAIDAGKFGNGAGIGSVLLGEREVRDAASECGSQGANRAVAGKQPNSIGLLHAARECWDRALALGEQYGYRNAQTTVIAPTGCLVGETLVTTDRGIVPLGTLGNVGGEKWQDVDFAVATPEGPQKATKFFVNGVDQTRRLRSGAGYELQGTLLHRIKVVDAESGMWGWKRFSEVAAGDIVPLAMDGLVGKPREVLLPPMGELYWTSDYDTVVPRVMTPALAELAGYFMGDGALHARGLRLCVGKEDTDVVSRLQQLAKQLFNLEIHVEDKQGYFEVGIHSVRLALWWVAAGLSKLAPHTEHSGKGYTPRIPECVSYTNDRTCYAAFLRGLFEADGTVTQGCPSWVTVNEAFHRQVKALLLTMGFPTSTKHDVSGWGQSRLYVLRLRNLSYNQAFCDEVGFMSLRKQHAVSLKEIAQAGRHDYVYLPEAVLERARASGTASNAVTMSLKRRGGITRRSAQEILAATSDPELRDALRYFYDTIETNEDGGEQLTYDISVPSNVTYTAGGFVSHNTIGLLMDCDTTGVEPDFALVKFKKLAGGGYFKIANQSVEPALLAMGYSEKQVKEILTYVMGTLSLKGAPHINQEVLRAKGFTDEELAKTEACLPSVFELAFAFSPWTLGEECMQRLGIPREQWQNPSFNLLRTLGFSKKHIQAANEFICGTQTIEGAPHLREEHYAVFDCANRCGRKGKRFIQYMGHVRMMAAAQPFISGAISKTINMPNEVSVADIEVAYMESWKMSLKAVALYRDGSKLSQPLNTSSDDDTADDRDVDDLKAETQAACHACGDPGVAVEGLVKNEGAKGRGGEGAKGGNLVEPVEKVIVKIVERPLRRRLPDTRASVTHKFDIAGHEGYITVGLFEDNTPGEVFITMAKQGSTIGGLMDTIATLISLNFQYGVPMDAIVRKFEHMRFEPAGMTTNQDIPFAKSFIDYVVRWMGMQFIPGYRAANAPKRESQMNTIETATAIGPDVRSESLLENGQGSGGSETLGQEAGREVAAGQGGPSYSVGNGHGNHGGNGKGSGAATLSVSPPRRTDLMMQAPVTAADTLSQAMSKLMGDAPTCTCGSITVRNGSCYKCLNCGASLGCS